MLIMLWTCMALPLLLTLMSVAAAQDVPTKRYSLKEDSPYFGTRVRRDVITNSRVPLDKPYHELSVDEHAFWKSQYEGIGPNDEPPFPRHGLKRIYAAIAEIQRKLRVEGKLTMFVAIDIAGKAASVEVIASPDRDVARYVAQVLMLESFKPASCDGNPCSMQFPLRVDFVLR
jgi:hypothetical protein